MEHTSEYDEYIEQFRQENNLGGLQQLADLVTSEKQDGWERISEQIQGVIDSMSHAEEEANLVSPFQVAEIESLGGSKEDVLELLASIRAESQDIFESGSHKIDEIYFQVSESRKDHKEKVVGPVDESTELDTSWEDFEKKNILRDLENVEWALERFSNEYVETLMTAVGKDSLVTSYNSDYVKVVSGSMYNEIMHELDISRSYAYNKRIDFARQSPEKKEELRNIAHEVGDRLHKIGKRRGLPSLGLGNESVTLSPEDNGSVSLLLSFGAGNSYRGIVEGEKKTVRDFKAEVLFNLQKKKKELEDRVSQ